MRYILRNVNSFYKERVVDNRQIQEPLWPLKGLHKSLAELLHRIEKPSYLFSPCRGKSHVDNACFHASAKIVRGLDIKSYYQSTPSTHVFSFFHNHLCCGRDISGILTRITTYKSFLPTGAPSSGLIAYFSYAYMWDAIDKLVRKENCSMTLYEDDLTISGYSVSDFLIWQVKKIIYSFGLEYHKEFYYKNGISEINGFIIRNTQLSLPHRKYHYRYLCNLELNLTKNEDDKLRIIQKKDGYKSEDMMLDKIRIEEYS